MKAQFHGGELRKPESVEVLSVQGDLVEIKDRLGRIFWTAKTKVRIPEKRADRLAKTADQLPLFE